jgi:ornithine cyclodeaminase/alanine dehydrogenase-like protein (mu-crystallin family)
MFSIITGRTVSRLVYEDIPGCVSLVRDAYLAHARGVTVNPSSVFLRFPSNPTARIIALPAHLGHPWNISGIKWIASYPANVPRWTLQNRQLMDSQNRQLIAAGQDQ